MKVMILRFSGRPQTPSPWPAWIRLFGVTMAERGVNQVVSVELAEAARMQDVG